ncbi:SCO3242 family prenyltransferase [Streptomyces sp. NPDC088146]|uniref:SCO3242 family prenyltransferase n=1 Tax=Streptomyces sp. NPDC088146 TaxID=3365829 RepID=UPI00380E11DB
MSGLQGRSGRSGRDTAPYAAGQTGPYAAEHAGRRARPYAPAGRRRAEYRSGPSDRWLPSAGAVARLVRAPAALTVPGDVLAGAAAAGVSNGRIPGRGTLGLAASSVCLYWAGMALNDYADRDLDAVERPERPIPSGEVSPGQALAIASGLTAAGLGLAALSGGRAALPAAVSLAGVVWAYDLALKATPAGPAAMAAARGLDVLLGSTGGAHGRRGRTRAALPAALTMAAHTFAVTVLSRREVSGATRAVPAATLAVTGAVTAAAAAYGNRAAPGDRAVGRTLAAVYLTTCGPAQFDAARTPSAPTVRRAVGAGIHAMMPLQAALTAAAGSTAAALPLTAALPLARRLARKVSPT